MSHSAVEKLIAIAERDEPFSDFIIAAAEDVVCKNASGWVVMQGIFFSLEEIQRLMAEIDDQWPTQIATASRVSRTYDTPKFRLRVSAYSTFAGNRPTLVVRRTPRNPIAIKDTGLPSSVIHLTRVTRGLILVSGATGAGKTTTIASIVDVINQNRRAHIATIEDPIEYVYKPKQSIFSQREVGIDTPSFYEGARSAMRQSPDVIVIGEIRDRETAETALLAGDSGHLVLASLHANSAYGAVKKLVSFFPEEMDIRLAALQQSLMGVIHQVMVPHVDGENRVLATEIIFNHKQQFSEALGSAEKVQQLLERKDDGISTTLVASLVELVKKNQVKKDDAIESVIGQGWAYKKLIEMLGA